MTMNRYNSTQESMHMTQADCPSYLSYSHTHLNTKSHISLSGQLLASFEETEFRMRREILPFLLDYFLGRWSGGSANARDTR
jgi:hypothetical protein